MNFPPGTVWATARSPWRHRRPGPRRLHGATCHASAPCAASTRSRPGRPRSTSSTACLADHPPGRPWVGICMVVSLDGSTVVDGRSGGLVQPEQHSRSLLRLLRAADVILVGASTVRSGGLRPARHAGPAPRRGAATRRPRHVGLDLFTTGAGFLVLPEDGPPAPLTPDGRPVDVLRAGAGRSTWASPLGRLTELIESPQFVHVEGGPHLNGSLLDADRVDELERDHGAAARRW